SRPLAFGLVVLGLSTGLVLGLLRWPSNREVARSVDGRFKLRDRVTTALELDRSELPIAEIQRADTTARLRRVDVDETARSESKGREAMAAAAGLALFTLLLSG